MNATLLKEALSGQVVSPYEELLAYEYLYSRNGMTLKKIAAETLDRDELPSQALHDKGGLYDIRDTPEYRKVEDYISQKIGSFDLAIKGTPSWPKSLADSERPAPLLYFRGSLSLMRVQSFSVVGSRKATEEGRKLAGELAKAFVDADMAVVTGLAAGIDTAATKAALRYSGSGLVMGVIGTPIDECYPKENQLLVEALLEEGGLLVSQVPFYRYHIQPFKTKRYYFPERNELMAAISDATVIVEASDTSGTLTQARACMHQNRPLFIMRHCYDNPELTWPKKWAQRDGVFVVESAEEIMGLMEENHFYRDCHE